MTNYNITYQKLYKPFSNDLDNPKIWHFLKTVLFEDRNFLTVAFLYSIAISLLGIAVPISVQLLINSVSFTALVQPIVVLGIILFSLLIFSGVLNALQFYVIEMFQRRIMAGIAMRVCLQLINGDLKKLETSNNAELVNRFLDVTTVQKTIPKFLTSTITFLLQSIIGLLLVSFYHPFFLIFSLVLIACFYFIYAVYFKPACISAFYESRRKYDLLGGFEDLAANISLFKSGIGQGYAKFKINELTKRYIADREVHFKNLFSQTLLLLALYAVASAFLLILGGYLVLKGQLTIGQLVAAELILSAILYSMSKFGREFENLYDLIAACEKLAIFFNIPLEEDYSNKEKISDFKKIEFTNAVSEEDKNIVVNLKLEKEHKYLIHDQQHQTQKFIIDCLHDFVRPTIGEVLIDGKNLYNFNMLDFRSQIQLIDDSRMMEGTLLENLTLAKKTIEIGKINKILKDLNLENSINKFPEKLNLRMIPTGWPLNEQEVVIIKIARAILLQPKIIIISEILDIIDFDLRQKILKYVAENSDAILIYFSNHKDDNTKIFDKIITI